MVNKLRSYGFMFNFTRVIKKRVILFLTYCAAGSVVVLSTRESSPRSLELPMPCREYPHVVTARPIPGSPLHFTSFVSVWMMYALSITYSR